MGRLMVLVAWLDKVSVGCQSPMGYANRSFNSLDLDHKTQKPIFALIIFCIVLF